MKIIKANFENIEKRTLGRTRRSLPILGLGAIDKLYGKNKDLALEIIQKAYDSGIRYFDTAYSYGDNGQSEKYLGEILPRYRKNVYINSKTRKRDYEGAKRQLEDTLKRLKVDYIDCLQIHSLENLNDIEKAMDDKNGVIRLIREAKDQGMIKYCGVTSHYNPWLIREIVSMHDFDTALCVVNPADKNFLSFSEVALPKLEEQNIGIVAMKVMSSSRLLNFMSVKDCLEYVWSVPQVDCAIVGVNSIEELNTAVNIAKKYKKMSKKRMKQLEDKTEKNWKHLNFYKEGQKWPKK